MIEVGESLGNRYRVAASPEALRPGVVFEVSDRGGAVVLGQILADVPVDLAMAQAVRGDLTVVPAMPTVLKPREIALSASGLPVGVLERPGLVRLRDRLSALDAEQKKTVAPLLLKSFGTLANDIAMMHQSGQIHGAISSGVMLAGSTGDLTGALLSGFGVTSFARRLGKLTSEPTARGDLVDLLGSLHDLFLVAGVQPDGGAAAKWTLLRHAAMHGEHPALASANALATQLNEIAAIAAGDDRGAPRPSRMPTINAPMRPRSSMIPGDPSPSPQARSTSGVPRKTLPPSGRGSVRVEPPRPKRWRFSAGILVGGLAVIGILGSAAAYYIWDARTNRGDARLVQPRVRFTPRACTDETAETALAITLQRPAAQFDATCVDGRIVVVTRDGTQLLAAQRGAARGQRFGETLRVGESVVEIGAPIAVDNAAWVVWRNGVGSPFGVAQIGADAAAPRTVPLTGWESVAAHGVGLLHVTARTAWLTITVDGDASSHGVLIEASLGERPRVRSWRLGEGRVAAGIPGPRPTVLMDAHADNVHELRAVTLDLAAIEALPGNDRAATTQGADLPAAAMARSEPLRVEGDQLVSPRLGALTTAGVRVFAVMTGARRAPASCPEAARCVGPGAVRLASFPAEGAGALSEVAGRAWLEDLRAEGGERIEVLVRPASPADAPMNTRRVVSVELGAAAPPGRPVDAEGPPRARSLRCGEETWILHDVASSSNLVATPAICAERMPSQ